ncbi:MAG: radical SAM protein, partial [Chitinophagales bacterium]
MSLAASIEGNYVYAIVDGNLEDDPWIKIDAYIHTGLYKYFACTVMPGPQLKQAITFTRKIKEQYPHITVIWGGYFASNQWKVCMESGWIDYIIYGPGDIAFPQLLHALENNLPLD